MTTVKIFRPVTTTTPATVRASLWMSAMCVVDQASQQATVIAQAISLTFVVIAAVQGQILTATDCATPTTTVRI
jgi:hypothetical protein